MKWKCESVHSHALQPAADRRAFDLHLAALDWSLVDPIIINNAEDIKASNWRDRGLEPFTHQIQNLITFCRRLPVALIADDVGLGKTISAGLILSELISRRRVNRALVICPKVLTEQWVSELDEKFGLVAVAATGAALDRALTSAIPIVVTTYDSARDRFKKIEPGIFDMCILDEAHKLRNLYGAPKPPALAMRVKEALERRLFRYVLMLTATPIQNKIWDLYSLIDLLKTAEGKPNPLGDADLFTSTYLRHGSSGRQIRPDMVNTFQKIVRESLTRTRRGDVKLKFPQRRIETFRVQLTREELALIEVVRRCIADLNPMLQVSLSQAMMSSPRALVAQAENMVHSNSLTPLILAEMQLIAQRAVSPAKLQALLHVIDLLHKRGDAWRAVIFTVRRETQEMIGEALRAKGISVGFIRGDNHTANQRAIELYRQQPPRVNVIVSTDAGAEGINLQAGNVLVNYDLPWNPMIVEQRIGRIQRLGSQFEFVTIVNLVGAETVEDAIVVRLTEKLQGVAQAIGDIEGILEAAELDEDSTKSFETRMRELVIKSLLGQDTAKAQKMIERDIEKAKEIFEEQRVDLDKTLGKSFEGPAALNAVPKIERKPHRMTYRDWVLGTKRAEGYTLHVQHDTLVEARRDGHIPERISFAEQVTTAGQGPIFAEQSARSYLPGKPAFERLVQHWVDHHAHYIADHTRANPEVLNEIARLWIERWPGCQLIDHGFQRDERPTFQGVVHIKVRAGTGVDSYEKIMRGRISPPKNHPRIEPQPTDTLVANEVAVADVFPQYEYPVKEVIQRDAEITLFCNFYIKRLEESLATAGSDAMRRAKIDGDFRPYVQAEVFGIEGATYYAGTLQIRFLADGYEYKAVLPVVPHARHLLAEPQGRECTVTKQRWPNECLAQCAVTGQLALRHRLLATANGTWVLPAEAVKCAVTGSVIEKRQAGYSTVSGIYADKRYLMQCQLTGERLLASELATSTLSGLRFRNDLAIKSELSGRIGTPSEIVVCAVTKRALLQDEAMQSPTTGEYFGLDQLVSSALSGIKAPPPELEACQETGAFVLRSEIGVCTITKKRVRRDLLVSSPVSGKQFMASYGTTTHDGKVALPNEVATCAWRQRLYLVNVLDKCHLCGLFVHSALLNTQGELGLFRELLDGDLGGVIVERDEANTIKLAAEWDRLSIVSLTKFVGPSGTVFAVCADEKGLLGFRSRQHGAVMMQQGEQVTRLGYAVSGVRRNGQFQMS